MNKPLKVATLQPHPAMVVSKKDEKHEMECQQRQLGIRDAMDVLRGKWKIEIIGTLLFKGRLRFKDMQREVEGIGAKMLAKELQDLEAHQLVKRTVMNTKPITVEYEITEYGRSVEPVICSIVQWGHGHRKKIMQG